MIDEYEYEELLRDPEMVQVLQRFMKPEQLKFELHEAELENARRSMIVNADKLWRQIYNATMCGDCKLSYSCGKNKVLYEKLRYTLNELGYTVSRNQTDSPNYYTLDIEW